MTSFLSEYYFVVQSSTFVVRSSTGVVHRSTE